MLQLKPKKRVPLMGVDYNDLTGDAKDYTGSLRSIMETMVSHLKKKEEKLMATPNDQAVPKRIVKISSNLARQLREAEADKERIDRVRRRE